MHFIQNDHTVEVMRRFDGPNTHKIHNDPCRRLILLAKHMPDTPRHSHVHHICLKLIHEMVQPHEAEKFCDKLIKYPCPTRELFVLFTSILGHHFYHHYYGTFQVTQMKAYNYLTDYTSNDSIDMNTLNLLCAEFDQNLRGAGLQLLNNCTVQ